MSIDIQQSRCSRRRIVVLDTGVMVAAAKTAAIRGGIQVRHEECPPPNDTILFNDELQYARRTGGPHEGASTPPNLLICAGAVRGPSASAPPTSTDTRKYQSRRTACDSRPGSAVPRRSSRAASKSEALEILRGASAPPAYEAHQTRVISPD